MERRLENIPQKPGSPDKKRKFDVLQHSAKKEDAKLKDSTPNIAHHSGEASGSSRPDESVKKQKTLLNDSIGEFNKMIEYYKNEQHQLEKKIWEKYPPIEFFISEYQWQISNARNVNHFVEKLNKAIEQCKVEQEQLYMKIKENRQEIEKIEDNYPSIEPFILEYQWQISNAKSENSEKRAENRFIEACSNKGDNIKAAANKVIKLGKDINQCSQDLANAQDWVFSIEEQREKFLHATHDRSGPSGPQTSFGQVQLEQATLPSRHEVHHQADPSDQADIPQDRHKQIEMLVADLVNYSGNRFRKKPIRIHMGKHKMNQEEYEYSCEHLYTIFKGSGGLHRIASLLYGTYSDKTVERKIKRPNR